MAGRCTPQVYAAPTEWNERLVSLLSSIAFRRPHQPAFAAAATKRLPLSLEVQNPTGTTTTSRNPPILLIVVSSSCTKDLDLFLENANQSAAFLVFHRVYDPKHTHGDGERWMDNFALLCQSSSLATFVIFHNVEQKERSHFWNQLQQKKRDENQAAAVAEGQPCGIMTLQSLPVSNRPHSFDLGIPELFVQIVSQNAKASSQSDPSNNPSMVHMQVSDNFSDTTRRLWLARLLFKYIFAVMHLRRHQGSASAKIGLKARL